MIDNPFPGPRPYRRATDRNRFFGREAVSHKVECAILSHRCVTLYGPSDAGKTSLVRVSVLPHLADSDDIRVVWVEGWPEAKDPTAWLASSMYTDLHQGETPEGMSPAEAVLSSVRRAVRGSPRLLLLYLDQLERLLYPSRDPSAAGALFQCIHDLLELPLRNVRIVLSLREDYLGRLRDLLQDRRQMLDHGIRIAPLTVEELTLAVCRVAELGTPALHWSPEEMGAVMLEVRVPGQPAKSSAEVQAAYGQILCHELFQKQAEGSSVQVETSSAEEILHDYLDRTLSGLGPLHAHAQRLLEDHLITDDGSRTVRTEKELHRFVPAENLTTILKALEKAGIVHSNEHQGSRYLEIGHDWLAGRVLELRKARQLATCAASSSTGGAT